MIRVLIVAGIRLYREGLAQMLDRRSGFSVVGAKADRQHVSDIQELRPDVVLVDMETADSAAIIRDVTRLAPEIPVVALAVADLEGDVLSCAEAGAAGYVSREGSLDDLVAAVENAARGELHCSPRIAGSLLRRVAALAAAREALPSLERLTIRESEIVSLIEQNLSNKQIATRLGIEVATVKNHVHNLLEKLNVHRRVDVARRVHSTRSVDFRS
jgi:two-component system nitrate/nitrite response regulator NarL